MGIVAQDRINAYLAYIKDNYEENLTCVFDGYNDYNSTKRAQQNMTVTGSIASNIMFTEATQLLKHSPKKF